MIYGLIGSTFVAISLCIACLRRSTASIVYAIAIVAAIYFSPFENWCDAIIRDAIWERHAGAFNRLPDEFKAASRLFRCSTNVGLALTLSLVAMIYEQISKTRPQERQPIRTAGGIQLKFYVFIAVALFGSYFIAYSNSGPRSGPAIYTVTRFITMGVLALAAARAIRTKSSPAIVFVCVTATLFWLRRWFWMENAISSTFPVENQRVANQVIRHGFSIMTGVAAAFLVQFASTRNNNRRQTMDA